MAKVHKSVGNGRERVVRLYVSCVAECTKIHAMLAIANRFMNFRHIAEGGEIDAYSTFSRLTHAMELLRTCNKTIAHMYQEKQTAPIKMSQPSV